jgi:glycosyltransferase involved in cell wall biosynthesis
MTDEKPLASCIIPVYNGERYLAAALESVFRQDYRPFEVIVVDDGSTDSSACIARSYTKAHYIYQSNQGVTAARNAGISASRGKFIAFLDQDDLWTPVKLSIQIAYLLRHPDIGYVLAKQRLFLEPGTAKPAWLRRDLLENDHVGYLPGTLVTRRSIIEQIGAFDPTYRIGSDTDWLAHARDAGIPMAIIPEVLLLRRIHHSNQSTQTRVIRTELARLLKASIDRRCSQ